MRKNLQSWEWVGPVIFVFVGIGVQFMPNIQSWLLTGIMWFVAFVGFIVFIVRRKHRYNSSDSLEVEITGNRWLNDSEVDGKPVKNPSYSLRPSHSFSAIFGLIVTNHSEEHKVHIDSAHIVLREKKWLWSGKPISTAPVEVMSRPKEYILENVDIEPQDKKEYSVNVWKSIPVISPFPRRSSLMLVLEFVGGIRRIKRRLIEFRHDPKQVLDSPEWRRNDS